MKDWLGQVLGVVGLGVLLFAILKGNRMYPDGPREPSPDPNRLGEHISSCPGVPAQKEKKSFPRDSGFQVDGSVGNAPAHPAPSAPPARLETATLGGGCFWCLEAVFQQLRGVHKVTSGYSGGWVKNPTYKQVCTGTTGHAEVVQILFDPLEISYEEVLEVFFAVHDPTSLNRQGPDIGPQYRSIILYHSPHQQETAMRVKERLQRSGQFMAPIVTEIVPFKAFYPAEHYHQDYFRRNPNQPYCQAVIGPKLAKFQKLFREKVRRSDYEHLPSQSASQKTALGEKKQAASSKRPAMEDRLKRAETSGH